MACVQLLPSAHFDAILSELLLPAVDWAFRFEENL